MAPSSDDLARWMLTLETWWTVRGERQASTVLAWGRLPGRDAVLNGTLWWVETELGELLSLFEDGDFRDLSGGALEVSGSAWLWHPVDRERNPPSAAVWMDRSLEISRFDQVNRSFWTASWNESRVELPAVDRLAMSERLRQRGWRRRGPRRIELAVFDMVACLQIVPRNMYEDGQGTLILLDRWGTAAWSDRLNDAVLSELIRDAREALGVP